MNHSIFEFRQLDLNMLGAITIQKDAKAWSSLHTDNYFAVNGNEN